MVNWNEIDRDRKCVTDEVIGSGLWSLLTLL